MNLSILLAEQIAIMGLMVLAGYLAGRKKLVTLEDSSSISKLILYLISPCITISALQTEFSREKAFGFLLAICAAIVAHGIFLLLDIPIARIFKLNSVERASIIYTNCGNLIMPIISYMLGAEFVIFSCAYITVQTILLWTHGISLVTEERQANVKKIIFNPNIIAIALGVFMFFMRIRIPELPLSAISRIGDCIGPTSMIVVGIMLGSSNLLKVFSNKRSWLVALIRLLFCPFIIIMVIWVTHATGLTEDARQILFISYLATSAPSASTVSQMANVAHKNEIQAGSINMMTVVMCIITMPLMTLLYQYFCM